MIGKLLLGACAALLATQAWAAEVTMRVSHQVPPAHHLHKMLELFKAEAAKNSNGAVEVQIFPANQAFSAKENHAAVARGSIEAALSVNQQWGATIPEMNVVVIPYFFTELEKLKKFRGSEAEALLNAKLEEKGVHNIAWFYITRESIFTSNVKPLIKVEDFQGVKIRGFNKIADAALVAVGAAPSAMPGGEVYQALQSGVLDAGLTDVSAAYSRKYYEVQKYGTVGPYISVYFHMYVNPTWWKGLKPEHRAAIEKAARTTEDAAFDITEKTAADAMIQLREKGMELHVQTPEEIAAWKAKMQQPVIDAFLEASPKDGKKIIELMKKL
jgi:C4-dicarboxylate-binding protein DctP